MEVEQPSSPGVSPIQLKDCIEPLLKLTLLSSIDESPTQNLGLSNNYCSNLLKDEDDDPSYTNPPPTDLFEGVPQYPLYKHLASALFLSISSGTFCWRTKTMPLIHEHSSLEQKESEWSKLIVDNGSSLVKMLNTVDIELHVQEPYFSQLKDGLKTVEGRCAVGDYQRIQLGALILFNKCLVLQVLEVHQYASFSEMLEVEGLANVLPGVETIKEAVTLEGFYPPSTAANTSASPYCGYSPPPSTVFATPASFYSSASSVSFVNGVQIYRKFYSEEKERSNGVLAIHVTKPASQLYDYLASILAGLSYEGVERLMGLVHTPGTILEALPPPSSSLLASFQLPYNPNNRTRTTMLQM